MLMASSAAEEGRSARGKHITRTYTTCRMSQRTSAHVYLSSTYRQS